MSKSKSNRKRRQSLNRRRKMRQSLDFTELEGRRMLSATPGSDGDSNDQICEVNVNTTPLTDGVVRNDSLSGNFLGDVDLFPIPITRTDVEHRFTVEGTSSVRTVQPFLRLFNASGTELASDGPGGLFGFGEPNFAEINFDFDDVGTYYLGVSADTNQDYNATTGGNDSGGTTVGTYRLTFEDVDDQIDEARNTLNDGFAAGDIDLETDVDLYKWDGVDGQSIRFRVDGDATPDGFGLDTLLRIFDDDGDQVDFNDDRGPGLENRDSELTFNFRETGTFYIGISSASNDAYDAEDGTNDSTGDTSSTGSYTITATEVSTDDNDTIFNAINAGNLFTEGTRSLTATIDSDSDVDLFRFQVDRAGSFVEIDLDTSTFGLNSRLRLFNSNGIPLETNIDSAAPGETGLPRESFIDRVLGPGVYFVGVSAQDNANYSATTGLRDSDGNSTGSYTLQIQDRLHVDTKDDTNTGTVAENDNINTLREAIAFANDQSGTQTITFQSSAFPTGGDAITLSVPGSNQLEITDSVIINGLGEDRVIVSANDNSRVFLIDNDNDSTEIDVTLRGLTIRDGNTSLGGQSFFDVRIWSGNSKF